LYPVKDTAGLREIAFGASASGVLPIFAEYHVKPEEFRLSTRFFDEAKGNRLVTVEAEVVERNGRWKTVLTVNASGRGCDLAADAAEMVQSSLFTAVERERLVADGAANGSASVQSDSGGTVGLGYG
jgi:hypothetical protein